MKRITVRLWTLRSEIEAAIERRIKESEVNNQEVDISDIKEFYSFDQKNNVAELAQEKHVEETSENEQTDSDDSSEQLDPQFVRQAPDSAHIHYGFALLSDINMDSILIFSKKDFLKGQSLIVEFLIPNSFSVSVEVIQCSHYGMRSRIISETKPDYRLQTTFSYHFENERDNLRKFLKSIEPDIDQDKKSAEKGPQEIKEVEDVDLSGLET